MTPLDGLGRRLAARLQAGLPLTRTPYADLARDLGISEADALDSLRVLLDSGKIRFFGGFFSPAALGLSGSLCALAVPREGAEEVAAAVDALPQVTHDYLREGTPNLWFTLLTASAEEKVELLRRIEDRTGRPVLLDLPVRETLKLRADFLPRGEGTGPFRAADLREAPRGTHVPPRGTPQASDYPLIRRLQRGFPLTPRPFGEIAEELGTEEDPLLARTRRLAETGILRRIGLSLHHTRMGYSANALVLWNVPEPVSREIRETVWSFPELSHGYLRERRPSWPYNLYAMFHGRGREEVEGAVSAFSARCALGTPRMFFSLREFKKARWHV